MTRPGESFFTRPLAEMYGRHSGYGFAGLSVSTAIGNFTQTVVDLPFGGGMLGLLNWGRTYNSRSAAAGGLGTGWVTSFSASLQPSEPRGLLHHAAAQVSFHDEDGRVLVFTPAAGGGFASPQDLDATLARQGDGGFTLACNSGLVSTFDPAGRLTGRSLEGQALTFGYDGAGLLVRVAHSSGASLALSYDGAGRITEVTASDGRTASYAYGPDGGLQSVTVPGGGVTAFETTSGSGYLQVAKITDADGNLVVASSYDPSSGAVLSQDLPGGGTVTFGYGLATGLTTVTTTPPVATATFQADTNGRLTKAANAAGNAATFGYTADGRLAQAVSPGGVQTAVDYDSRGNRLSFTSGGATTRFTYDSSDRMLSSTSPVGGTTRYAYTGDSHIPSQVTGPAGGVTSIAAAGGLITSLTDADGNTTTFGHDGSGNLTSLTSPRGETTSFSYDALGNRTGTVLPDGSSASYGYDTAGRVTSLTLPGGARESYQYSPAGLLLETTDPTGAITRYAHDGAGNQTGMTDPLGRTTTFTYDANGRLTTVTNPAGGATERGYDATGNLISVTDAVGAVTSFGYDADGRQTSIRTPAGTTTTAYDARGNVVSVTDPAGGVTLVAHDADNRVTSMTGPAGGTWLTTYDPAGRIITNTNPLGAVTRQEWTPGGNLAAVVDPLGRKTIYAYDKAGHQSAAADPEGGATQYAYDAGGRVISVTTPAGLLTRYVYDPAGRLTAVIDPRGWITRYEFNQRGDKTAVMSPSGALTRYDYDAAGQLTQYTDPNGSATEYVYDDAGNVVAVTDAKGATTRYGYDARKRLISTTDPLGRETLRDYDKSGNLVTVTDPSGQAQHMAYDAHGRLTEWTGTDGTKATYTYDPAGRRTSMTDATGTTHYSYDDAGQLLTVVGPDGATTTSGYDAAGQRTSLTYPDGLHVTYGFDGNGRLTGLQDSRAGQAEYALDPDGRLLTEQLPGRLARRYHYEYGLLRQFLTISDGRPVARAEFSHDPDGRIMAEHDTERAREYRYDAAGQLVYAASRPVAPRPGPGQAAAELHLTYDAAGNRARARRDGTETHYRYDAADQLIAAATGDRHTDFRYDSSGRLTEESDESGRRVIDYDGFGRPSVITSAGHDLTERIKTTFNGDGLVTALTITTASERAEQEQAASVNYRWSFGEQIPQILSQRADHALDDAERGRTEGVSADFAYGYGRVFATTEKDAATFHHDAFGSAIRTDETRAWAQAHAYDVFGEPRGDMPGDPRHAGDRPPGLPRFGYRGELALERMLYLRARCYDTSWGRFTTHDAVSVPAPHQPPVNAYAYADNDPLNLADPLGSRAVGAPGSGIFTAIADAAQAVVSVINRLAQAAQPQPRGRSGMVVHYYPPILTPDVNLPVLETIVPPIFQSFVHIAAPRGGVQIAHCDLYLNDTQTMQLVSGLDDAGGITGIVGFFSFIPESLIAVTEGMVSEVLAGLAATLFVESKVLEQINQKGGNEGIYFDFWAYRTSVAVPVSFSWPWDPVHYRTYWSAWVDAGNITVPLPPPWGSVQIPTGYVSYQGASPASAREEHIEQILIGIDGPPLSP